MSRRSIVTTLVVATLSIMTLAGLILAVSSVMGGSPDFALGGRVALVEVNGVIMDDRPFLRDVRALRQNGSVRAWVVAINSPGGSVAPSQSIYQTLERIRNEDQVPVVASIGSVGASGGYYVALGADSILALPGSTTGSIGVILQYPNVKELLDKVGVEMVTVQAGAVKDMGSPYAELDPEERAILTAMITDVHEQFIEVVARNRALPVDEVRPLADGRVLTGRQAMREGLVDRMGNLDEAIAVAGRMAGLGSEPRILRPPREQGDWLLDALLGQSTARGIRDVVARLAGAAEVTWPSVRYMIR